MNPLEKMDRRAVIEEYIRYETAKKAVTAPDTTGWDWTSADAIDAVLAAAGYKYGIPAGFTTWERVALTVDDLRACAVVDSISCELGSSARDLRTLEAEGRLVVWKPRPPMPAWLGSLEAGNPLSPEEPFLLRPAVSSERPAEWYLEDGSGRATTIVANASRFAADTPAAYGLLGTSADHASTFMSTRFHELLTIRRTT